MIQARIVALALVLAAPAAADVVPIDAAWLAARAAPYVLDAPDTTYRLEVDVRADRTAFVVAAAGVTLDLGGHAVTYNDTPPIVVANGGFEAGSDRDVPGWDLAGAPAAGLAPNTNYLFGDRVLRVASLATPQRIVSAPIAIPEGGRTYVATITPVGSSNARLVLSVVGPSGAVLASGRSSSVGRGLSAIAKFVPAAAGPVRLVVEAEAADPTRATSLDLDLATLATSADFGVIACRSSEAYLPATPNLPAAARKVYRRAAGFRLCNGRILQGRARGYGCSPVYAKVLPGLAVDGVETLATGMDTVSIDADGVTGGLAIEGCTIRQEIVNVGSRLQTWSAILAARNAGGPVTIRGNRILDSPQVGILFTDNDPLYRAAILDNVIRQENVVTNGYAIVITAARNFEVARNTVAGSGRGIDLDGYGDTETSDGDVHHNDVGVRERPEREYKDAGDARALRMRSPWDQGAHRRLHVHDNTLVAITGPGLVRGAVGVKVNYSNDKGTMTDAGLVLEGNLIKAIATAPGYSAAALCFDALDPGINLQVRGNVLESNDTSLKLMGTDGGPDDPVADVTLRGNTLRRSVDGDARAYVGVLAGWWTRPIRGVRILDTRLEGGATAAIVWAGTGAKDVAIGQTIEVRLDRSGMPADGMVTAYDEAGRALGSGPVGPVGTARIEVITDEYRGTNLPTVVRRTPRRVAVEIAPPAGR